MLRKRRYDSKLLSLEVLELLLGSAGVSFGVSYWDGTSTVVGPDKQPAFSIHLNTPSALRHALLLPRATTVMRGLVRGDSEVEGSSEAAVEALMSSIGAGQPVRRYLRMLARLLRLPRRETGGRGSLQTGAATALRHYEMSHDFYRLWLGNDMVYSSGYFSGATDSLESAQKAKLQYVCDVLSLKPTDVLLDVGCGWGALAVYAAQHCGCRVIALTKSPSHGAFTRERVQEAAVTDRVEVIVADVATAPIRGPVNKISSIEMAEHLGPGGMRPYFSRLREWLDPGGLVFSQLTTTVGIRRWLQPDLARLLGETATVRSYLLPDLRPVRVLDYISAAEAAGFELVQVCNRRQQGVRTFREWLTRLEANWDQAVELAGYEFAQSRRWLLAAGACYYRRNWRSLYSVLHRLSNK